MQPTPSRRDFRFKQFAVTDSRSPLKVGTDGVLLGAWAGSGMAPEKIVDLGAGCGIVGLMLAQRFEHASIQCIEINAGACQDMRFNIDSSPWPDRCKAIESDFASTSIEDIDLIACNPPFFLNGEHAPDRSRAAARHAGTLSPTSAVEWAAKVLTVNGRLALIVPPDQINDIEQAAAFARLNIMRLALVRTNVNKPPRRALVELTRESVRKYDTALLTLRDTAGNYSDEYKALTSDFHLSF